MKQSKFATICEMGDFATYIILRIIQILILIFAIAVFVSGFWS